MYDENRDTQLDQVFANTPVVLAYLFGSRAQSHARPDSDYDVAVLFDADLTTRERGRWQLELIGRLIDTYSSDDVDLVVLNDAPPILRFEAIRHQRLLYNRDDQQRMALHTRTMQEWFDWAPRYRRMQQERLKHFTQQNQRSTPMANMTTITRHLEQLQVYIDRLIELQTTSDEELKKDWRIQSVVERTLQLAIEATISVSEQLITLKSLRTPDSGREALKILADAQIIPDELALQLQQAVSFRNIIVHQYLRIDQQIVYDVLQTGPTDLKAFLAAVSAFLQSYDSDPQSE
ncbi:MAG: HepT-like ribonuclease domain-containing protein [Chloroflexota bacterium]